MTVQTTIDLAWQPFNVDLDSVAAWIKNNYATDGYCGASADSQLHLHFTALVADADVAAIQAYWEALTPASAEAVAYTTKKQAAQAKATIANARAIGNDLINTFGGQNILLGITQAGMTKSVRQTMSEVTECLTTGSLIDAIAEIKAIPSSSYDNTFITAARLLSACNTLESQLGLPLSTSLS